MYDATIRFVADNPEGIRNTRTTHSDSPETIVIWAARYGVALHYNRPRSNWLFQVTATASDVDTLDVYCDNKRVGIYTKE